MWQHCLLECVIFSDPSATLIHMFWLHFHKIINDIDSEHYDLLPCVIY